MRQIRRVVVGLSCRCSGPANSISGSDLASLIRSNGKDPSAVRFGVLDSLKIREVGE